MTPSPSSSTPSGDGNVSAPSSEENMCGICLHTLTDPVQLPCTHSFCSGCLNGWRSKYTFDTIDRKCPMCRETIPLAKEQVSTLGALRTMTKLMEDEGADSPDHPKFMEYWRVKVQLDGMEEKVGERDSNEILRDGENFIILPEEMTRAAGSNDIRSVLAWLGPKPTAEQLNAKDPKKLHRTLLHEAVFEEHSSLVSILLQFGANVDPLSATGRTPLAQACDYPRLEPVARLLLEWGAEKKEEFSDSAAAAGSKKLARLLKSELGGRRCEVMGMETRVDLNGKTGVAEKFIANKDRYKIVMEHTNETFLVSEKHLKRRDRTPRDCGYYLTFEGSDGGKGNKIARGPFFTSKEEAMAYKDNLAGGAKSGKNGKNDGMGK